MLVLTLDTSTAACAVAVVDLSAAEPSASKISAAEPSASETAAPRTLERVRGVVIGRRAAQVTVDARRHGELLAPSMRAVLAQAGVRPTDLDAVVVGAGPGPFTSLRVGMVTGAAFADALGLPVHGVCSLDAIGVATTGSVAAVTDARRREVFWARYRDGIRVGEPAVGRPADVARLLADAGVTRVIGPGAALYAEIFGDLVVPRPGSGVGRGGDGGDGGGGDGGGGIADAPDARDAQADPDDRDRLYDPGYPRPELLVALAGADLLAGRTPGPLVPLYLRRPDATEPHAPKPVSV